MDTLDRSFYRRDADEVARDLLGKVMYREEDGKVASGFIVETEAYFGGDDPASRVAQDGKTGNTEVMWMEPGTVFIYMVHGHWMLNVVTGERGEPSAVLFRALEPKKGLEKMKERRDRDKTRDLCSGPGKLTQALGIDKSLDRSDICSEEELYISEESFSDFSVGRSKRVGVTEDLDEPLRFYVEDNRFISR